jgi:hypothetical protein
LLRSPSKLPFGAAIVYVPKRGPDTPVARSSRTFVFGIKDGKLRPNSSESFTAYLCRRLRERSSELDPELLKLIDSSRCLVPLPGHAPAEKTERRVTHDICGELRRNGFGGSFLHCVERRIAIPKSSFSATADRATPETHFRSMTAFPVSARPDRITLVDDVVTKGATAIGAAWAIRTILPDVEIALFALAHTTYSPGDSLLDPRVGFIEVDENGAARRNP